MLSFVPWAFGAGVIAAVNPCGFALLPGYITRLLGDAESRPSPARGVLIGVAVTAGKLTVFAVLAVVIVGGSRTVLAAGPWAGTIMGALIVLIGLWTLAGRPMRVPIPALRAPTATGYRGAYLFGLAYGAVSISCCLPIFIGVFAGLGGSVARSVAESALLFCAYAVGVGVILVPLFAVTGRLRDVMVVRVRRFARFASPISGVLLLLAGALLLLTWIPVLGGDLRVSPMVEAVLGWQSAVQRVVLRFGALFWLALGIVVVGLVLAPALRRKERTRDPS